MTHHLPPMPGPIPSPQPAPSMPEDIGTARQLWWGVTGVGVVQLIASFLAISGQRNEITKQYFDQMHEADPTFTMAQAEQMTLAIMIFGGVVAGLVLVGLTLLFAHLMARGKFWARAVLTMMGIWLVLIALLNVFAHLFGAGSVDTGGAMLVAGGAAIVQGVLAGGAVYLMHRKDSTAYFLAHRRR
ncbi:hypothetical protein [Nocardia sp. NPDC051832]|uniref:hypothetical protein n=1 Tax=Nocardia sp. NPDC051832 TaxID=3155673 RepID=UPI0034327BC6